SKKCNCPWSIRLNYNLEDDKYHISQVDLHHNHNLIPPQLMHISSTNREIPTFIKEEIFTLRKAGIAVPQIQSLLTVKYGPAAKTWIMKDMYNLIDTECMLCSKFEAHDFLLLQQKHNNDPEFSYEFELDNNNRLKHVLWVYASQKRQYMRFHDTIVYDNTYKSNYFSMPFGVFIGVTNNGLSYCAAGALLRDEMSLSFEWLFESFIRIFGTAPNTILTDNDLAMSDAIHSVLTNKHGTKHGLCIWHMLKNIRSNMTSKLGKKYNMFHADLMKCLNHYIDQNEFEDLWNCIMENDNYAEAKLYLEVLSRWHEQWAPAYLKKYFFADMSSTQRGESMNSLLKGFVDCKTRLTEFLAAFERALYFREEVEHISAYKELVHPIPSDFPNPIENQAASYDNGVRCFKLSRYERPDVIRHVCYDGKVLACCCRNLEFAGIVCCHSLAVVVRLSLTQLDPVHFPKHWRKDPPELELAKDYVNFYSHTQPQDTETLTSHESFGEGDSQIRLMHIHRLSRKIASKVAMDSDKCTDFTLYLEKYLEALYASNDDLASTHENTSASSELPIINNPIK
ncbi:4561_t:CDS:2, partial [Dentiscutata heterogama]